MKVDANVFLMALFVLEGVLMNERWTRIYLANEYDVISCAPRTSLLGLLGNQTIEKRHCDGIQLLNILNFVINFIQKLILGIPSRFPSYLVRISGTR